MEKENRKALISEYKEKKIVGGIYCIVNDVTGKHYVFSTPNIDGSRNLFEFAKLTSSCILPQLKNEWEEYGVDAFRYEKLAELEKGAEQTKRGFTDDLKELLNLWTKELEVNKL